MARLELDELTHARRDGTPVVDRVSLDVPDGELLAVLGPRGSGKSTLLRMLIGLADITAGELRLAGERANDWAPAERDLAMVHQDYAPYPHLSVRDNLAFPLRMLDTPRAVVDRRVEEVAHALELTVHLDRAPSQLSGSQRQRVALGRVLVRRPNAFLLDEPLSQVDAGLRDRIRGLVTRQQRETGTTTLYATRDPDEAMAVGDRVAVLSGGRLEQVGPPRELYERPATLAIAATAGPLGVLPATVDGAVLRLPMGEVPLEPASAARLAGRERVLAAVRPEHVEEAERVAADRVGVRFTLPVASTEWAGSEPRAHLRYPGPAPAGAALDRLERRAPGELIARLDPAGTGRDRRVLPVWVDPARILLFDPDTGAALPRPAG